jgi:hypothetical protein
MSQTIGEIDTYISIPIYDKFRYDKTRRLYMINGRILFGLMNDGPNKVPMSKSTDAMIESFLDSKSFIDTVRGDHNGFYDSHESHAQRIASLIDLRRKGVIIHPVIIFIDTNPENLEIEDGWHRMRAAYYLNEDLECHLEFD